MAVECDNMMPASPVSDTVVAIGHFPGIVRQGVEGLSCLKIVAGIASGYIGPSLPNDISEIAMPQMRGWMLTPYAWLFASGQLWASIALKIVEVRNPRFSVRHASQSQGKLLS